MVDAMVALLGEASKRAFMTGVATGTRGDNTTYPLGNVKFQRTISGLGSADEQDATDSAAIRAILYTPRGEPISMGDRISVVGEASEWFALDEDTGGTARAVLKVALMRQDSATAERPVTLYRLRPDGTQAVLGPYSMHINYDNRVARETSTAGSQVRRIDGAMTTNSPVDIHAGDMFTIDMGGSQTFSGVVVDVNRSSHGRIEATISVQRGISRTPQVR